MSTQHTLTAGEISPIPVAHAQHTSPPQVFRNGKSN